MSDPVTPARGASTVAPGWRVMALGSGLGDHAQDWDRLNLQLMGAHPMLRSAFVDRMLAHFSDGSQWIARLEGPDGVDAMCVLQRRGIGLWTTFLPAQAQVGPLLIGRGTRVATLVAALPGLAVGIDLLCVDPDLIDLGPVGGASESTRHALTMNVRLDGGFDAYWAARSSSLRQNMRRYERRAVADGLEPRYIEFTSPDEIARAVVRYAELESRGWKGERGTALSPDNEQGRFYVEVMQGYAQTGDARVYELWMGGNLAASRLVIGGPHMLVMLKTTYDEALDKYAPGRLLLRHVLACCFAEHPGKVVEFYTDASQDQLAWATGQRAIRHWTFYRSARTASLVAGARLTRQLLLRPALSTSHKSLTADLYDRVDDLPADALRLLDSAQGETVQLGADWYRALTGAVFKRDVVRFCVVREHDACIAIIPAQVSPGRLTRSVSALSNYYTALYSPVLKSGVKPQSLALGLRVLSDSVGGLTRMTMSPMDPQAESYETLLAAMELVGWVPFRFFCFGNWTLRPSGSWQSYERSLDGRLRNTIARMRRKFLAKGGRLEIVSDAAALDQAMASYLQVYARSWKVAEPFPDFLPTLVRTFAPRGWIRLGLAWIGDRPVAAQLWFVTPGRAEIYKLAHDEAFKQYSPGTLLTALMMEQVMDIDDVAEIDYLIGDDPYKKDWMDRRRERWGLVAYDPRTLGGIMGLMRELLGRGARTLLPANSSSSRVRLPDIG